MKEESHRKSSMERGDRSRKRSSSEREESRYKRSKTDREERSHKSSVDKEDCSHRSEDKKEYYHRRSSADGEECSHRRSSRDKEKRSHHGYYWYERSSDYQDHSSDRWLVAVWPLSMVNRCVMGYIWYAIGLQVGVVYKYLYFLQLPSRFW